MLYNHLTTITPLDRPAAYIGDDDISGGAMDFMAALIENNGDEFLNMAAMEQWPEIEQRSIPVEFEEIESISLDDIPHDYYDELNLYTPELVAFLAENGDIHFYLRIFNEVTEQEMTEYIMANIHTDVIDVFSLEFNAFELLMKVDSDYANSVMADIADEMNLELL